MSSIDERIVKMTFDNSDFEGKISKTLQSLEKLNETLSKTSAADGLKEVSKALKDVQAQVSGMNIKSEDIIDVEPSETKMQKFGNLLLNMRDKIAEKMTGLMDGADKGIDEATDSMEELGNTTGAVGQKFSALNALVQGIFLNLGSKIADFGTKMLKAITIEPIATGFQEYETKMGAIQTILTNTAHAGTTLDDVTTALNQLNTYADKTIYNFAEMTKNIGTFTAAGVDLDTSVAAIKGIANLAAASGSNSQQASTAMYQLSQALAAGKVSLADWNSVVNAGMGGKLFQDALVRTSEVLGTNAEDMIKKYGSFRESLTKGEWLTSEVLTETLKQLSGAYSEADLVAQGFTKSQAKSIVELANNASAAATEVKTVTQLFDTMKESVQSGWATSWEHIIGDKDQATEILTKISKGFEDIIGPSTEARNKMLQFWNESGGRDAVIKGLTNVVQSLGKGLGAIGDAWKEVFPSMTGEKLTELSNKFKDLTEKFKMNDKTAKKIKNTFKGIFDVFKSVGSAVGNVIKGFSPLLGIFPPIGSAVLSVTSTIGKFASVVSKALSEQVFNRIGDGLNTAFTFIGDKFEALKVGIGDFFNSLGKMDLGKIFGNLGNLLKPVGTVLTTLGEGLGKAIGTIDFGTIMKGLQTASGLKLAGHIKDTFKEIGGISDDVKNVTKSFSGMFKEFGKIGSNIVEVLSQTKDALESWQRDLNARTLLKIAGAIAILAGALLLLSGIDPKTLITGLAGLGVVFAELALAYGYIAKIGGIKGAFGVSTSLLSMAAALLTLSVALKILSTISIGEMLTGLVGLVAAFGTLFAATKVFSGIEGNLRSTSVSLIAFGASLMVMALALKMLGSIDTETLGSGLFAMAATMVELAAFLKFAKFDTLGLNAAKGIFAFSAAMLVFAFAVKSMGSMDASTILKGLAGIAAVMAGIALFGKVSGDVTGLAKLALGVGMMAASMMLMSAAIGTMASNDWETLLRGLTGMAGALGILGVAAKLINPASMATTALSLGVMGAALIVIGGALNSLGSMSWDQLAVGLTALAGSLAILGVAMSVLSGGTFMAGAASMLIMAAAMALLTPQIMAMSMLSWGGVAVGLTTLAGALGILAVAGLAAQAVAPGLLILAGSVALLGAGCALAGIGIAAMGTGLATIAAVVAASGFAIVEFLRQLIGLLPQIGLKAGEAMVNFADAITKGAPQIMASLSALLTEMLKAIQKNIPLIAQTGMDIILAFAEELSRGIPQLVTYGMEMVIGVLEGIAANIGRMVDAGCDVLVNFLNGVSRNLGRVIQAGIELALSFIEGVADGITNNQGRIEAAISKVIRALITTGISVIKGGISGFTSGGRQLLQGLCNGIKSMLGSAKSAVKTCINAAKTAASNLGGALVSAGKSLIQGLVRGITSMASSVASKARSVVQGAINAARSALKINSPSKVFMEIGQFVDKGFIIGMERYAGNVAGTAGTVAGNVVDSFSKPLSALNNIIDSDVNTNPVITPVLDLSNVRANSRRLNDMIPGSGDIALSTDAANIMTNSMGAVQNGVTNSDIVSAIKDLKDNMPTTGNTSYNINGITYDDGSNIVNAVETLVRAARIERRI